MVGIAVGIEVGMAAAEVDCSKLELVLEAGHIVAVGEHMYFLAVDMVAGMVVGTVVDMLVVLLD